MASTLMTDIIERAEIELEKLDDFFDEMRGKTDQILRTGLDQFITNGYNSIGQSNTVGGSATVAEIVFRPPLGVVWEVRRISTTGSSGGACGIYLDALRPDGLVEVISDAEFYAGSVDNFLYVVGGRELIFRFTAQTASQVVTANLQVREFTKRTAEQGASSQ